MIARAPAAGEEALNASQAGEEAPRRGRGSAGERAYEYVRNGILSGEIPVGAPLAESNLARVLSISRTPVRQGLRLLLEEGLLEIGPRRQLLVARIPPERRRSTFVLREALESVAVREACRVMTIEEIDYLRLLLIRQRRAAGIDDPRTFIDLDEEFHLKIAAGAQLPLLTKFLNQIRAFVRLMGIEAVVSHPGRMDEVVTEHERIVDELEARDEDAAYSALMGHLRKTQELLVHEEAEGARQTPTTKRARTKQRK